VHAVIDSCQHRVDRPPHPTRIDCPEFKKKLTIIKILFHDNWRFFYLLFQIHLFLPELLTIQYRGTFYR